MHSVLSVLLRFTVHDYPFDLFKHFLKDFRGRRGRDCIVDGFTTTTAAQDSQGEVYNII